MAVSNPNDWPIPFFRYLVILYISIIPTRFSLSHIIVHFNHLKHSPSPLQRGHCRRRANSIRCGPLCLQVFFFSREANSLDSILVESSYAVSYHSKESLVAYYILSNIMVRIWIVFKVTILARVSRTDPVMMKERMCPEWLLYIYSSG